MSINSNRRSEAYDNFTAWARPILDATVRDFIQKEPVLREQIAREEANSNHSSLTTLQHLQRELVGQLLELYANDHGYCDFTRYQPRALPPHPEASQKLQQAQDKLPPEQATTVSSSPRLCFSIIAHDDFDQLQRLVQAIHQPQHYIVIHLDRFVSRHFQQQVRDHLEARYDNVVVLCFGSIVYQTDSVSRIHWRIVWWLHTVVQLTSYGYFVTLDRSAFPLYPPTLLAQQVATTTVSSRSSINSNDNSNHTGDWITHPVQVWLGELTLRGQRVLGNSATHVLRQRRLIYVSHAATTDANEEHAVALKLHKRLPRSTLSQTALPEPIAQAMRYKTHSGNQAIYSFSVIQQMLQSTLVQQLFALSKYGCCCCLEEHNWMAALELIGYQDIDSALFHASMFEVWGGNAVGICQGGRKVVVGFAPAVTVDAQAERVMRRVTATPKKSSQ